LQGTGRKRRSRCSRASTTRPTSSTSDRAGSFSRCCGSGSRRVRSALAPGARPLLELLAHLLEMATDANLLRFGDDPGIGLGGLREDRIDPLEGAQGDSDLWVRWRLPVQRDLADQASELVRLAGQRGRGLFVAPVEWHSARNLAPSG